MYKTPLGRLRLIGLVEGVSFLLLLGVAMPLKYLADAPLAVQVVGTAHGVLFILFLMAVFNVAVALKWWSPGWLAAALAASVLPFGTFILDGWLKRRQMLEAAKVPSVTPSR